MNEEKKIKNIEKVMKLIEKFSEPRRTKVKEFLEGKMGEIYFTAPASSMSKFHSCYPGGLVEHSLNVLNNLYQLSKVWAKDEFPNEKLIFVSLFHDLGKIGDGEHERYIPNKSDWHREKLGKLYEINDKMNWMPTSEAGLFILQKYGIDIDYDEYMCIRLNDGPYPQENRIYDFKTPKLAMLLHWSDMWATMNEKDTQNED